MELSCCEYSFETPDDGQLVCPIHVQRFTKLKMRISASCSLPFYECIRMHGPQNVKSLHLCRQSLVLFRTFSKDNFRV